MDYKLTVTEKQLATISRACDLLARVEAGQYTALHEYIASRNHSNTWDTLLSWECAQSVNFNLTASEVPADIRQVLRHRLSWDRAYRNGIIQPGEPRKWPEMMQVDYDEPMFRSDEPRVVIEAGPIPEPEEG
jgi:hypothetical protein